MHQYLQLLNRGLHLINGNVILDFVDVFGGFHVWILSTLIIRMIMFFYDYILFYAALDVDHFSQIYANDFAENRRFFKYLRE